MEIIEFLNELHQQHIVERDFVTVTYFVNGELEISGTLIPYTEIVPWEGDIESRIIHPRNGGVIVVKTTPDGLGPDIGMPISIESIISILREN